MKISDIFVSVVLVTDEHTIDLKGRVTKLSKLLRARYANYEIVVIDNGLETAELGALRKLLPTVACIRVIRLSRRNHDTDTAIFAGVEASIGDYVCTLYNDDPIELIPDFMHAL